MGFLWEMLKVKWGGKKIVPQDLPTVQIPPEIANPLGIRPGGQVQFSALEITPKGVIINWDLDISPYTIMGMSKVRIPHFPMEYMLKTELMGNNGEILNAFIVIVNKGTSGHLTNLVIDEILVFKEISPDPNNPNQLGWEPQTAQDWEWLFSEGGWLNAPNFTYNNALGESVQFSRCFDQDLHEGPREYGDFPYYFVVNPDELWIGIGPDGPISWETKTITQLYVRQIENQSGLVQNEFVMVMSEYNSQTRTRQIRMFNGRNIAPDTVQFI